VSFDPRRPSSLGIGKTLRQLEQMLRAAIRRVHVLGTGGGRWQVGGYEGEREADVPVFGGIGFHSRPADGGNAEAILLKVGAAGGHSVIVATRDEGTRLELEADETAIFTSTSKVLVKADGTIEIGTIDGTAVALATKADVEAVVDAITNAVPLANDGGAQLQTQIVAALSGFPVGTTKLKGE
jgi:phage gp45-like